MLALALARAGCSLRSLWSVLGPVPGTSAGTAYAATKIGTKQLKNNAVTSAKIKNRTIAAGDLSSATVAALRGATGPQGPAGQQGAPGPGSVTFDRSIVVNGASQTVAMPFGTVSLLCNANQVRAQVNVTSTDLNPVMVAGIYSINGGAPLSINNTSGSEFAVNDNAQKMWLDVQVSDRASGRTGTLRIQSFRESGVCRWIGQYIP